MNLRVIALAALMAFAGWDASAKVKLPAFFSSGMVLQQQTTCRIWGTASTNSRVKVVTSWNGKHYQTVSNAQGQFEVKVATPAAGGPYSITLDDGEKTTLDSILIGEVWLCSGQSNMEMPIKGFKAQPVEGAINEILNGADDNLRFFSVKRNRAHPSIRRNGQVDSSQQRLDKGVQRHSLLLWQAAASQSEGARRVAAHGLRRQRM